MACRLQCSPSSWCPGAQHEQPDPGNGMLAASQFRYLSFIETLLAQHMCATGGLLKDHVQLCG